MEITFFVAKREASLGVASWDDIPSEPIGDPVRAESPALLTSLAEAVCPAGGKSVAPLRDATCRSFPVWEFDRVVSRNLSAISEETLDEVATTWLTRAAAAAPDTNLHELHELLRELRVALAECDMDGRRLYALLEEKAL